MATLTVWKFDFPTAADEAESTLESLSKEGLITIHDAATISWDGWYARSCSARRSDVRSEETVSRVPRIE